MFCRGKKNPELIESMASLLILGGVIPLCAAFIAQFTFHLPPCDFCLYQRYPYGLVIAAGIGSLLLRPRGTMAWRVMVALGFWALCITGILGLLHTGMEQGLLHYSGGCVAQTPADASLEALRAAIAAAPLVSCDAAMGHLFGLSLASWNFLWALGVIVLMALQYRFDMRRYASHR